MVDERHPVVVVGASAAGLRCACRLARLQPGRDIRVVEARSVFSVAACGLPYVISGDVGATRSGVAAARPGRAIRRISATTIPRVVRPIAIATQAVADPAPSESETLAPAAIAATPSNNARPRPVPVVHLLQLELSSGRPAAMPQSRPIGTASGRK